MKNHIEIIKKDKKIKIYGNQATIDRAISFIENLDLTGIEEKDRLIIQRCIDDNKIGATILYDGNTVYSFNKIVDKYKKLQKSEDLMYLSDDLYKFFTNGISCSLCPNTTYFHSKIGNSLLYFFLK